MARAWRAPWIRLMVLHIEHQDRLADHPKIVGTNSLLRSTPALRHRWHGKRDEQRHRGDHAGKLQHSEARRIAVTTSFRSTWLIETLAFSLHKRSCITHSPHPRQPKIVEFAPTEHILSVLKDGRPGKLEVNGAVVIRFASEESLKRFVGGLLDASVVEKDVSCRSVQP